MRLVGTWSIAAQAITSLALVIFAVLGFNTWKRQVRKGMNVVWTVMAALHRGAVSFQRVATELLVSGTPVDFDVVRYRNDRALGGYLKELEEQCVFEPVTHIWTRRKQSWLVLPGTIAQWQESPTPVAFAAALGQMSLLFHE